MFKSLKLKLILFFLITNITVLSAFSFFIYKTAQKGVSDSLDTLLKIVSIDVIPDIKDKGYLNAKDIANELFDEFSISPLHVKIIYYNKQDKIIEHESVSSSENAYLFEIPLNEMGNLHSIYYFDKGLYRASTMFLFDKENTKIFFQLAMEKTTNSPYLNHLLLSLAIANPIILIIFLFIANVLINRTLQPVKNVIKSVRSISANRLSNRIDGDSIPTEIKELVETFNKLLDNLEESFKRISTFSCDASHELKTPLTVIRGEVEVSLRQERTPQEYRAVLEDVLLETVRVQETIDQLFLLTKKDTAELSKNFQEIYLDEVLMDVLSQTSKLAAKKFVHVDMTHIIPATIYANEVLIKIAIENLIRNAIIYSNEHDEIHVSMDEDEDNYLLLIEDNGCGIDQRDLPFIFERFYRANKARSRKGLETGTGLGLAIVKMIFDIHHYEIIVTSVVGTGTKVIVKIPKMAT